MQRSRSNRLLLLMSLSLLIPFVSFGSAPANRASAQQASLTFPETGKTLSGRFMQYWQEHGGLAQQGLPISDVMSEKSDTDGKIYTVQYFERAVLESHPENAAPNDVLLSLLGVFLYKDRYGAAAPEQAPDTSATSRRYPETGKYVGGGFLKYWDTHGGLAQQGLPISDEFVETSALNGKPYKVQYFERAVFEYHPENAGTPYEVLLSQLGRFRYAERYSPKSTPIPTATLGPVPTATPEGVLGCDNVPVGDVTATPNCGPYGTTFRFKTKGFAAGQEVIAFITRPDGTIGEPQEGIPVEGDGTLGGNFGIWALSPAPGDWAITVQDDSYRKEIGYFRVTGPDLSQCVDGPPPLSRDASVSPACGIRGYTSFYFAARGFKPGEEVGIYLTLPNQTVYGQRFKETANKDGYVIGTGFLIYDIPTNVPGVWALTYEGVDSHLKRIAYFKLYKP